MDASQLPEELGYKEAYAAKLKRDGIISYFRTPLPPVLQEFPVSVGSRGRHKRLRSFCIT